jgi:hypothetical protein
VGNFNFSAENLRFDASWKPNLTIVYDRNGQARQATRTCLPATQAYRRSEQELEGKHMTPFDSRHRFQIAIAAAAALMLSGCAMLDTGDKSLPLPTGADASAAPAPTITMEIRASGEKPEIKQVPLDNGSTVQQMLEKTKLVKEFRRMDLEVLRVTGDERAKLAVKYDHTKAHVKPEYDYALYPGDHLIVQEVTKTAFDDMLESIGDPLRRATGNGSAHRPNTM